MVKNIAVSERLKMLTRIEERVCVRNRKKCIVGQEE